LCVLSHDLTYVFFRAKKLLSKIKFTKNCLLPEEAEAEERETKLLRVRHRYKPRMPN